MQLRSGSPISAQTGLFHDVAENIHRKHRGRKITAFLQLAQAGNGDALAAEAAVQISEEDIDILGIRVGFEVALHFFRERADPSLFRLLNKILNFYDIGFHDSPPLVWFRSCTQAVKYNVHPSTVYANKLFVKC